MAMKTIITLSLLIFLYATSTFFSSSIALPLSAKSRWIFDEETGQRVKLACANWAGHLEPMLPEHLDKQPLSYIASRIRLMGLNCVRLTWATDMYIYNSTLTVAQSFKNWNLTKALDGITKNNPQLLNMTLVDAQKAVIYELGAHGVYTVLDCQVSRPQFCCADNDGNGFWGDTYFDPDQWLQSQITVARRYKDTPAVVGMSVRNELRGPRQNETLWRYYTELGANTIHKENPYVLVLLSGLNYDTTYPNLKEKPFNLSFTNKLLYEYHRYAVSEGDENDNGVNHWLSDPVNEWCEKVIHRIDDQIGFIYKGENPAPLMISEWGINEYGVDKSDNLYLTCLLVYMVENDVEWAIWGLQGAYYIRNGVQDLEEPNGLFNATATIIRNPEFVSKLQIIENIMQDPNSKLETYLVMYHPLSGKALQLHNKEFYATDFLGLNRWSHDGDETPIKLLGTDLCLKATGDGLPVDLSNDCTGVWREFSPFQIATKGSDGKLLCLDYDPYYSPKLVTRVCMQQSNDQNIQTQWIKLIKANVN